LPAKVHTFWRAALAAVCTLAPVLLWPARCAAYSVLAHEAIIDSAWDTNIKPVLLKRFPNATADELRQAHGYAYGGAFPMTRNRSVFHFRRPFADRDDIDDLTA